jgi:hypothetical protein
MTTEARVEKIRWLPLALLTAMLTFVGTVAIALNGSVGGAFMCRYAWGTLSKTMILPVMGVIPLFFSYLFRKIGLRMNIQSLATLFVIGIVIGMRLHRQG